MNQTTLLAMSDELTKIAGIQDRDYVRDRTRQAGKFASEHFGKFKNFFNRQGPLGQGAIISGIAGGAQGALKGFTRNDPKINYNTGELSRPGLGTRVGRAVKGSIGGAAMGTTVGAATGYAIRKLTSA